MDVADEDHEYADESEADEHEGGEDEQCHSPVLAPTHPCFDLYYIDAWMRGGQHGINAATWVIARGPLPL